MEIARGENTGVQILLRALAQVLVFVENLFVKGADVAEFLVGSVLVAVYLALNLAFRCRYWDHALYVKKVVTLHPAFVSWFG